MRDDVKKIDVAIIVGSKSDLEVMATCTRYLDYFGLKYELKVLSAHRNPQQLEAYLSEIPRNGVRVIIAAAGMAAHLPGVIASKTSLPVIGVPLAGSALNGMDALFSIVQMPAGIPVATVAIGKAGAANAAVLAARILALNQPTLKERLDDFHKQGARL